MTQTGFDPAARPRRFDLKMDEEGQWRALQTCDVAIADAMNNITRLGNEVAPVGIAGDSAKEASYTSAIGTIKTSLASIQAQLAVINAL